MAIKTIVISCALILLWDTMSYSTLSNRSVAPTLPSLKGKTRWVSVYVIWYNNNRKTPNNGKDTLFFDNGKLTRYYFKDKAKCKFIPVSKLKVPCKLYFPDGFTPMYCDMYEAYWNIYASLSINLAGDTICYDQGMHGSYALGKEFFVKKS